MRLASQINPNGVQVGSAMKDDLKRLIQKTQPCAIIETGTHLGTGSTKAILDALKGRDDFKLISIEANPDYYRQAKKNLELFINDGFVELLNGISVPSYAIPETIDDNYPPEVITDHHDSREYLKEINFSVPYNQLEAALKQFDYKPHLVLLDSAGHMGTIEFHHLMSIVEGSFYLVLDDTLHRKHYKTLEFIKKDSRFEVLIESKEKFGHAVVKYNAE